MSHFKCHLYLSILISGQHLKPQTILNVGYCILNMYNSSGRGHVLYLAETIRLNVEVAELYSHYSYTDGKCVELFYQINGDGTANLTLRLI